MAKKKEKCPKCGNEYVRLSSHMRVHEKKNSGGKKKGHGGARKGAGRKPGITNQENRNLKRALYALMMGDMDNPHLKEAMKEKKGGLYSLSVKIEKGDPTCIALLLNKLIANPRAPQKVEGEMKHKVLILDDDE